MQSLHDTAVGPTFLPVHKARLPRQKRQRCRAALPDSGDQDVQNRLVDVIRLQIGQEKVRDFVQSEQDKLRQTAEEAKAEVDELSKLSTDRSNLLFESATANINRMADEFEQQLQESRAHMEAEDREFMEWEDKMAIKRRQGLFFQSLYRIKRQLPAGDKATSHPAQDTQDALDQDTGPAQAARSTLAAEGPLQGIAFSFLTAILTFAVVSDLLSSSPSYAVDALYVIIALALGVTIINT